MKGARNGHRSGTKTKPAREAVCVQQELRPVPPRQSLQVRSRC